MGKIWWCHSSADFAVGKFGRIEWDLFSVSTIETQRFASFVIQGKKTRKSVPFILFGCFGFIASFGALLLFETLNKKLADTIREAEQEDSDITKENVDKLNVVLTDFPVKTDEPLLPDNSTKQ